MKRNECKDSEKLNKILIEHFKNIVHDISNPELREEALFFDRYVGASKFSSAMMPILDNREATLMFPDVDMDEYMIGYFIDLCVDYRDRYENRLNTRQCI